MIDLAKIATGDAWEIAGHRLRPLELGHAVILQKVGADDPTTEAEAALAVLICARPWDCWQAAFSSRWFGVRFALVMRRMHPGTIAQVRAYLASNSELPIVTTKAGRGNGDTGTPYLQHVRAVLISECGYQPAAAWSAPYGQAMWDYLARMEYNGAITITDRAKVEEVREAYAKLKTGAAKRN